MGGLDSDLEDLYRRRNAAFQRMLASVTGNRLVNSEIFVMNADGSRQRNLTRNPAPDGDPVWSPDGRKILFVSKRDGYGDVYVMNADGSKQRNLT